MIAGIHWEAHPQGGRCIWTAEPDAHRILIVCRVSLPEGACPVGQPFEGWVNDHRMFDNATTPIHAMERLAAAIGNLKTIRKPQALEPA